MEKTSWQSLIMALTVEFHPRCRIPVINGHEVDVHSAVKGAQIIVISGDLTVCREKKVLWGPVYPHGRTWLP
jgi:hypothetical protein